MTEKAEETKVLIPIETKELSADKRGRVYLGKDYANSKLTVAVLEVQDDE